MLVIIYFSICQSISNLLLTKKRGGEYIKKLMFAVLAISFFGSFPVIVHLDLISMVVCSLYVLGSLLFFAFLLSQRKSIREDYKDNLVMVIDEVKGKESFGSMDFLLPNITFTAKSIIRYGPKKTARSIYIFVGVLTMLFFILYNRSGGISDHFLMFYTPVVFLALFYGYRKNIKAYRIALLRAKEGSYKDPSTGDLEDNRD